MLMAMTSRKIAAPGISIRYGLKNMKLRPSETISPQDGVGGWVPRPRNDSAASTRIAIAISSVATTIIWLRDVRQDFAGDDAQLRCAAGFRRQHEFALSEPAGSRCV